MSAASAPVVTEKGEGEARAARAMEAKRRGNETPPTEGRVRVRAVNETPPTVRGREASPSDSGARKAELKAELRGLDADREAAYPFTLTLALAPALTLALTLNLTLP